MAASSDLWTLRVFCAPDQAPFVEEVFEEDALAVSVLAPPRRAEAVVEILMDGEPEASAVQARVALLSARLKGPALRVELEPVGSLDWIKKVAQDFPPLPLARWTVFGAAHVDKIKNPRLALQIDATSAFGTGEHPTTKGCLLLLDRLLKRNPAAGKWTMLDMGCGSGILALAFSKAVHGRGLGVDMDAPSVAIANGNKRANGVAASLRFVTGRGYAPPAVGLGAPYDLVMANIFARPLCHMAKDLKAHLRPGGFAILSGILNGQVNAVLAAHRAQGIFLVDRLRLGEWSALALQAPIGALCEA